MRKVEHEITLIAFDRNRQVVDIVETSNHFASHFVRRWRRDAEIISVAAERPGVALFKHAPFVMRNIR